MEERQQLSKTFKPSWIWAIALGSGIGWGAYVAPVDWMAKAGPLGTIIGFAIGAVLMMIIAVSYGFLIKSFPVSGGEFAYSYVGFGRNHAYICGWFLVLGYMSIIALNASALALLGKYVIPSVAAQVFMYEIAGWEVYLTEVLIASLALIVFAYLNIKGAQLSGRAQFIFCIIMIAGVLLLFIGALFHPSTSFENVQPLFNPEISSLAAVLAIVAIAPWAYVGFDNVPQAAEEFKFSPQKAFSLIIIALIFAGVVYCLMILTTALGAPWQDLVAQSPLWGTGDVVTSLFGGFGLFVLVIAVLMGIFTGLNGFYISASRLLFAMGRAQILPKAFAKLHPKYNTPHVGVIFACIFCLIAPWFGRQALLWIVDMASIGVTIAYFYTCAVAYKFFRWSEADQRATHPNAIVAPGKKVLSLLGAISGLCFLGLLLIPGSPAALGVPSLIALLVWIALGILFYLYRGRAYRAISKENLDYYIIGDSSPASTEIPASKGSEASL